MAYFPQKEITFDGFLAYDVSWGKRDLCSNNNMDQTGDTNVINILNNPTYLSKNKRLCFIVRRYFWLLFNFDNDFQKRALAVEVC